MLVLSLLVCVCVCGGGDLGYVFWLDTHQEAHPVFGEHWGQRSPHLKATMFDYVAFLASSSISDVSLLGC